MSLAGAVLEASTKVIYFTERTVTPFMSTISKPLGDIRLRDFKSMFDRPGLFRFHFKNYDPEYGLVKEEVRDLGSKTDKGVEPHDTATVVSNQEKR